ncbi:broad specificity 5'(3')-nucleotidase and polyphosphatase [Methylocella tundrae]|uniref:5'-nucleotidase SurE n=1 Tax=Methylocella tundrae TaxID=227605 RepID=A0A4U8Z5S6_METTU|nr:5'/3'-nucleotidase SurE [Methylocella tundrae]WPP04492.1 5'/3'-nucleotidase SurE [Methylocella tundrae]VFU10884.1 broad specificity 5'(3')-nucleotidase and polyphosphatase [Methylocella tundrae]VTZ50352.1 broad specificity 5'(3')-nucleotidase and polyphosphatase [Methylocella tundrae]
MRILVTNDDGVHAPGLGVLERIARSLSDDVYVVAPETDQSGVAHSLSLNDPLRLRKISERRYAVKGTPTDCVIMGVRRILDGAPPDIVLSGVNCGQNVAEDVIYSGTVAGAMEGAILGIPSIALSQSFGRRSTRENALWSCAETHAPALIAKILAEGVAPNIVININFPDCPPEDVQGVSVTVQGRRGYLVKIDARADGRGNPYYWIAFDRPFSDPGQGTDVEAMAENRISVTPLRLDLTDTPTLTRYAQALR